MTDETHPTIIAWAWGPQRYHDSLEALSDSLEELGLPHRLLHADLTQHFHRCLPDTRERIWAYRYIPTFIRESMEVVTGDVLYIHADMTVHGALPEKAFHGLDIGLESAWSLDPPRPKSVLAAPIFVRYSRHAFRFLELWEAACLNVDDDRSEHVHLHNVWRHMRDNDRSLQIGTFAPELASIRRDADTLIRGHK